MDKNNDRTARKKEKILRTAVTLFKRTDAKKVTMDDIAFHSNVSKMTIYNYFGDKESFYGYVCDYLLDACYREMIEMYEVKSDVMRKMTGFIGVITRFIAEEELSVCIRCGQLNDDAREKLESFELRVKNVVIGLIKEGKQNGLIPSDISDEYLYYYIDMGINYFQSNHEYRDRMMNDQGMREEFMVFLWKNVFIIDPGLSG